jgi:hypothetical protein
MAAALDGSHYCVMLADRDARIVATRWGSPRTRSVFELLGEALHGTVFREETTGTNSLAPPTSCVVRWPSTATSITSRSCTASAATDIRSSIRTPEEIARFVVATAAEFSASFGVRVDETTGKEALGIA